MNMDNFDKEIWYLHRKLFHRYVKYAKYFRQATEVLPAYQCALQNENVRLVKKQRTNENQVKDTHIISLLTSSSEEVSEDEQEEEEEPKVSDGDVHM
jgi:hypothetical protein